MAEIQNPNTETQVNTPPQTPPQNQNPPAEVQKEQGTIDNPSEQAQLNFRKLQAELEAQRKANESLTKKIKDREEEELKIKGEFEVLAQKRLEELEAKNAEILATRQEIEITNALSKAGIDNKKLGIAKLAIKEKNVKYNPETSMLEGLDEALTAIKTEFPEIFGSTPAGTVGTTNTGADAIKKGKLKGTEIAALNPLEYAARQEEIQKALVEGNVDWES